MQNKITYSPTGLFALSGEVLSGVKKYGVAIGLLQHTEAKIIADRDALTLAMEQYAAGKAELKARHATMAAVFGEANLFVTKGRDNLKEDLGTQFGIPWIQLNYVGTLRVGSNAKSLLPKVSGLKGFYTLHPDKQIAQLNLTAAEADVVLGKVGDAVGAVNEQKAIVKALSRARTEAARKVHSRLRGVIKELSDLIDPLDARWTGFGLNMPGAAAIADVPENVTVVLIGNNAASVKWSGAARADYYRVWKRVLGTDTEFVAVGSPADLDFTIENLPATAQVEIAVSAVNTGGESAKSGVVTITTL